MHRGRVPGNSNTQKRESGVRQIESRSYIPLPSHDADAFKIDYKHLGQRLRDKRVSIHRTQEEVAEAIGITPAFIGHIERGERSLSLDKLIRLSHLYGTTIDYLLTDTLPPDSHSVGKQVDNLLRDKTDQQKAAFMDIMNAVVRNL